MPGSKKLDSAHRGRHIAESSPLLEFTLFPKLPKHIRVMIWETTLTPRIVEIYRCGREEFFTCVPCPSALEIYQDSRAAVIQHYPLCFGTFWYPPQIRFNFSLDIIYLDFAIADELPFFFAILSRIELAGLRYLAFDMTLFVDDEYISAGDNYHYQDKLLQGLRRLGNVITGLEQLIEIHDVRVWAEHCHWDVCKDDYKSRAGEINPNLPAPSGHFDTWKFKNSKVGFSMRKNWVVAPAEPESPIDPWPDHREFRNGIPGGRFKAGAIVS